MQLTKDQKKKVREMLEGDSLVASIQNNFPSTRLYLGGEGGPDITYVPTCVAGYYDWEVSGSESYDERGFIAYVERETAANYDDLFEFLSEELRLQKKLTEHVSKFARRVDDLNYYRLNNREVLSVEFDKDAAEIHVVSSNELRTNETETKEALFYFLDKLKLANTVSDFSESYFCEDKEAWLCTLKLC